ncbi:hypothetical protein [Paracidovorax citrulli]|uniref:hypothetical protein n=1 Tax=Paracidovorax citrulli TaxID=80869 RepID=UPI001F3035FD|nr:hypothetical protein [Paracidovorax citrulli]
MTRGTNCARLGGPWMPKAASSWRRDSAACGAASVRAGVAWGAPPAPVLVLAPALPEGCVGAGARGGGTAVRGCRLEGPASTEGAAAPWRAGSRPARLEPACVVRALTRRVGDASVSLSCRGLRARGLAWPGGRVGGCMGT